MLDEKCWACENRYNEVWLAADALWDRFQEQHPECEFICLPCFAAWAWLSGIPLYWECAEGEYPTKASRAGSGVEEATGG